MSKNPSTPERIEWLKSYAAHLRQRASDNGCYGSTVEGCCVTNEPDLEKWCDYCRCGESAVQIELLIAEIGSASVVEGEASVSAGQERSAEENTYRGSDV